MTRLLKDDEHGFLLLISYFRLYYKDCCFLLFSCFGLFLIKLILHCFPEYIVTEYFSFLTLNVDSSPNFANVTVSPICLQSWTKCCKQIYETKQNRFLYGMFYSWFLRVFNKNVKICFLGRYSPSNPSNSRTFLKFPNFLRS